MKKHLLALLSAATLAGCNPKNDATPTPVTTGVYILSEGQFLKGDGVVSAFDKSTKNLVLDAFGAANNGAALGDVVQDMGVVGNVGYICVNNSNRVQVVSLPDFKALTTFKTPQPRYFAASATRGYVTAWRGNYLTGYAAGTVLIIDLSKNTVIDSVKVGTNPERPAVQGNQLYVPNSYDNTITVVDLTTKATTKVTVPAGPQSVVVDANGSLWALCDQYAGITNALVHFAPGSTTPQLTLTFPTTADLSGLAISADGQSLFYSYAGLEYKLPITATTLPTAPFIRRSFNGFAQDPRDGTLFAAVSTGYTSNGRFLRYPAAGGAPLDSFTVKVGPNGFAFY